MNNINLSNSEEELLRNYSNSPLKLIRLKSQCILMRNRGLGYADIEYCSNRTKRTLKYWVSNFKDKRMASIFTGHKANLNASKLTLSQISEIKNTLSSPPSSTGLPKEFWDPPTLKSYVKATYGVVYESNQSYHHILKFSNLSFKYPEKFDIKRNEKEIAKRLRQIKHQIDKYKTYTDYEVLVSDETRIEQEAITRRAWLPKGKKTIIEVKRTKEYQNYIGFLNQTSYKTHLYKLNWQNQVEVIKALKKLIKQYPNKKLLIIWDNAGFHKGKLIREQLQQGKALQNIHLINLPPYAPDKNPIEHVWKYAKDKVSNIQRNTFEETVAKFESTIRKKAFKYKI